MVEALSRMAPQGDGALRVARVADVASRAFVAMEGVREAFERALDSEARRALEARAREFGASSALRVIADRRASARALESARALAHDALHCGSWKDVDEGWRGTYALATLAWVAKRAERAGERFAAADALRELDLAALLGDVAFKSDVNDAIACVKSSLPKRRRVGTSWCDSDATVDDPSASRRADTVARRRDVSMEAFFRDFMAKKDESDEWKTRGVPVVVEGLVAHWPATTKWRDRAYLDEVIGDRTVPIEVGKEYTDDDWSQKLMTVRAFMDDYFSNDGTNVDTDRSAHDDVGYLAQHELFEQCPELRRDIDVPLYCALGTGNTCIVNAWFGPTNTESPAHTDPHHNLLCQAVGVKRVRLFAPNQSEKMYPREDPLSNTSRVDVMHPDLEAFPLFADVQFFDATLTPGDALYIPPGWWHRVSAATPSFSVSFWWD